MLKVGILSGWHVHARGYAKELAESGLVQIAAIWDEDAARGRAWATELGAEFIADVDALLAREDIPAVVCNAPTTDHPALILKAAAAGKHVFTEKLLAVSAEECERLCKAIDTAGKVFCISLPLRATKRVLYVKKLIEDGTLGRVTGARFRRSHSGVSDHWLPEYWFDVAKTGGGAMMDLGAHPAYILPFLFGAPKRLAGFTANLFGTAADESAIALAEFEGGILATGETSFVTNGVPDLLEVYGTAGSVFMRGEALWLNLKEGGGRPVLADELPEEKPSPVIQFVKACIEGGGSPEHLGTKDALVMTRFIEAVYASDASGKAVFF
ncbi:MAG: Gfo/Idh/MocA family oxidoreductase [Christensenellaceae bacterium]|jgi:predicted dehydrogenase|nr:Gfo/Idh/MocA family oxidoreductase [Christensenellaceae bacterium]